MRIKHRPDYILRKSPLADIYLEYKTSRSPRFSEKHRQWDVVPIEAESWNECRRLSEEGHKVALLIFCPYHPRPLTCEMVSDKIFYRGRQTPGPTQIGTGIDLMNVDLSKFRTLSDFLEAEMQIPRTVTIPILNQILVAAKESRNSKSNTTKGVNLRAKSQSGHP